MGWSPDPWSIVIGVFLGVGGLILWAAHHNDEDSDDQET